MEERRDREVPVLVRRAQDVRGIGVGAPDHVVLEVDGALREARGAGRVQPEADVVRRRVRGRELGRRGAHGGLERGRPGGRVAAGDEHVPEVREPLARLEHLLDERRRHDDGDGAAVLEDVAQVVRRQERVRRDRDRADLDRAEERVDEGGRVQAEDDDALLHPDAELAQRVAAAVDARSELAVGDALALAADRERVLAHAAMRVDERLDSVVAVGELRQPEVRHSGGIMSRRARGTAPRLADDLVEELAAAHSPRRVQKPSGSYSRMIRSTSGLGGSVSRTSGAARSGHPVCVRQSSTDEPR